MGKHRAVLNHLAVCMGGSAARRTWLARKSSLNVVASAATSRELIQRETKPSRWARPMTQSLRPPHCGVGDLGASLREGLGPLRLAAGLFVRNRGNGL